MKRAAGWLKNTFTKEKMLKFLDKQGFYIVLFACIAIIVATAIITSNNNLFSKPEQLSLGPESEESSETTLQNENEPTTQTDAITEDSKVELTIEDVKNENAKSSNTTSTQKIVSTAVAKAAETSTSSVKLISPVPGEILNPYAVDHLVYSTTLEQWCTHSGVDITAPSATEVKAAAAGTIESIENDDKLGITITIDHGNGIKTKYGNLSTGDMVKKGDKVQTGQVISAVGNTALFEVADPPHLHFEVIANGKTADPQKYIKP